MRLKATKKAEVALQAVKLIPRQPGHISGAALAKEAKTSGAFLSQCMAPLVAAGWVVSKTGRDGGYSLVASKLSVLDVVEAVEGPTINTHCVVSDRRCGIDPPCVMHENWAVARVALRKSLAQRSAI